MSKRNRHLKLVYRTQLIRELQAIRRDTGDSYSPEVDALILRNGDDAPVASSDLYILESALIERLSLADLQLRVVGYRDLLSHLLTKESYRSLSTQFSDIEKSDQSGLLSESQGLLRVIYRRYEGVPAVEQMRGDVAADIVRWTLLISAIVALLVWGNVFPLSLAVGAFGALGASISTIVRLYKLDPRHEPFKTWLTIESGRYTLILAPAIGFAFALVLYLLMRSGLLSGGGLFPETFECWTLMRSEMDCGTTSNRDMAKLFAWGFLAGWAERMVPDVLNRIAPQAAATPAK